MILGSFGSKAFLGGAFFGLCVKQTVSLLIMPRNFIKLNNVGLLIKLSALEQKQRAEQKRSGSGFVYGFMNKFLKLTEYQETLASYGIQRHFFFCDKYGFDYDFTAINEILNDAKKNKSVALQNQKEMDQADYNILTDDFLRAINNFERSLYINTGRRLRPRKGLDVVNTGNNI